MFCSLINSNQSIFCSGGSRGGGIQQDDDNDKVEKSSFSLFLNNHHHCSHYHYPHLHSPNNTNVEDTTITSALTKNGNGNTTKNNNTNGRGMIDEVVVHALSSMGFEDRQRHLNEQHGVFDDVSSFAALDHNFLASKFQELDAAIDTQLKLRMVDNNNTANHHTNTNQSPSSSSSSSSSPLPGILLAQAMMMMDRTQFIQSTYKLRLRILKSERFDAQKAALRLIRYFDLKLELFGSTKLHKTITYEDLSSQDRTALQCGFLQYIQGRDTVGRRLLAFFPSMVQLQDPKSLQRLFFYYDSIVNLSHDYYKNDCDDDHDNDNDNDNDNDDDDWYDNDDDDRGYVLLIFHLGPPSIDTQRYWKPSLLPIMPSVTHTCFYANNTSVLMTIKSTILRLSPELRAKIKVHAGSQTEWMYEIMGFGIPRQLIPLSDNGEIKLKNHYHFMEYRKKLLDYYCNYNNDNNADGCNTTNAKVKTKVKFKAMIEIPNNHDVLFGRGRPFQNHMGNVRLQYLVEEHMARYNAAKAGKEKSKVVETVIQQVKERHGRFLCQDNNPFGVWMPVDTMVAKEKVSQMFRNARKKLASTTTPTSSSSTTWKTTFNNSSNLQTRSSNNNNNNNNNTHTRSSRIISPITTFHGDCNANVRVRVRKQKDNKEDENNADDNNNNEQESLSLTTTSSILLVGDRKDNHDSSSSIKKPRQQLQLQLQLQPNLQPQQYTFAGRFFYEVYEEE